MRSLTLLAKMLWCMFGLYVFGLGVAVNIKTGLGAAPWDVLHIGLTGVVPWSLSTVIVLVGLVLIGVNWLFKIPPTLGMVLNMASIGPFAQYSLSLLSTPSTAIGAWVMLVAGVLLIGLGTAIYTSAGLGAGPRDGLMIALTRLSGWPVGLIKNGLDASVGLLGWLLGGPIGVGSVAIALILGPSVQLGMAVVGWLGRLPMLAGIIKVPELRKAV